jgi:iron(III) transport system permease protein
VLSVGANVLAAGTGGTWAHLASTVLGEYVTTTLVLVAGVGLGTTLLGIAVAWAVTHLDFPGRRTLEWALVLPLAMPAYVLAYAWTDLLQVAGPVQTWLRELTGWRVRDYWFPDVRSLGGAVAMLVLVLYPYVYLLVRAAFLERGMAVLEAGRSLGLSPWRAFRRIALPIARPAVVAGVALALMEALADYGTVSYFGVQTFTTGIYRAWFSLGDRTAAAQLSMALLLFVVLVLAFERASRGRARYALDATRRNPAEGHRLHGLRAAGALAGCSLPLLLGFVVPALALLDMALASEAEVSLGRLGELARHSVVLGGAAAAVAALVAVAVAYARRVEPSPVVRAAHGVAALGYAVPGSVIAVGTLIPLAFLDRGLAAAVQSATGVAPGLLLTGTIAALVYAIVVRTLAPALQTVDATLGRITPHMDDAARSLGLPPGEALRRVHLPLLRPGVLAAALLVFIDAMKELPATLVMRPFGFDTLATEAYRLASDERLAEAAVPSLAIVAVGVVPLVLLGRQLASTRRTR